MRKSKQLITKSSRLNLNTIQADKLLRFQVFLSKNATKYEFLTGKVVLPEKDLIKKSATIKRFHYFPLGKELKVQTEIAKNQCQKLDGTFEFDKIIKK